MFLALNDNEEDQANLLRKLNVIRVHSKDRDREVW
jgi:hypothetical protein